MSELEEIAESFLIEGVHPNLRTVAEAALRVDQLTKELEEARELAASNELWHRFRVEKERLLDRNTELQKERDTLRAVVKYAANMPDDPNMPLWAQELRHRARTALHSQREAEDYPTGGMSDEPGDLRKQWQREQ